MYYVHVQYTCTCTCIFENMNTATLYLNELFQISKAIGHMIDQVLLKHQTPSLDNV